ncbi:hypothetical protein NN561_011232 [Cricetulus griseus]
MRVKVVLVGRGRRRRRAQVLSSGSSAADRISTCRGCPFSPLSRLSSSRRLLLHRSAPRLRSLANVLPFRQRRLFADRGSAPTS